MLVGRWEETPTKHRLTWFATHHEVDSEHSGRGLHLSCCANSDGGRLRWFGARATCSSCRRPPNCPPRNDERQRSARWKTHTGRARRGGRPPQHDGGFGPAENEVAGRRTRGDRACAHVASWRCVPGRFERFAAQHSVWFVTRRSDGARLDRRSGRERHCTRGAAAASAAFSRGVRLRCTARLRFES